MKVLIADKFAEGGVAALREAGCEVAVDPGLKDQALRKAIADTGCNVLIVRSTKVTGDMLKEARDLRLVIRAGSGYDTIDVGTATARDIRVCNCPGMNSVAVAELVMGVMIALDRRIVEQVVDLERGGWNKKEYSKARGLKGRTLGIIGLGRIGYEVAKRALAFDMQIVYSDIVDQKEYERELGIQKVPLEVLLGQADFISVHVPGGGATKHLIGAKELALMKPSAFLVNCARGGIVDEEALAKALSSGKLGGAALDVFEIEPGANDTEFKDPVVQAPRLYGTHHVGASTDQAQDAVGDEAVRIVRMFMEKGEFINCVNPPK